MIKEEKRYTILQVINPHDHNYMISIIAILANSTVLTPN